MSKIKSIINGLETNTMGRRDFIQKSLILGVGLSPIGQLLSSVSAQQTYAVKSNYIKINNIKYYRSNGVQLGDVGEKKTSVFSVNRVDSQSNIPAPKMKVQVAPRIAMSTSFASDLSASISYGKLDTKAFRESLIAGELVLVRFFMNNRDIENAIESSPNLIESIRNYGRDTRVVSDVLVVVKALLYERVKSGGTLSLKRNGIAADAETYMEASSTVALAPGTMIAYMLQKIDWEEHQKKNWAHIKKLIEDPHGL